MQFRKKEGGVGKHITWLTLQNIFITEYLPIREIYHSRETLELDK